MTLQRRSTGCLRHRRTRTLLAHVAPLGWSISASPATICGARWTNAANGSGHCERRDQQPALSVRSARHSAMPPDQPSRPAVGAVRSNRRASRSGIAGSENVPGLGARSRWTRHHPHSAPTLARNPPLAGDALARLCRCRRGSGEGASTGQINA